MPSHAQPPFGRPYSCFVDLSHVPLVVIQQGSTPRGGAVLVPGIPAVLLFVDPISPLENLSVNFPFLEFLPYTRVWFNWARTTSAESSRAAPLSILILGISVWSNLFLSAERSSVIILFNNSSPSHRLVFQRDELIL